MIIYMAREFGSQMPEKGSEDFRAQKPLPLSEQPVSRRTAFRVGVGGLLTAIGLGAIIRSQDHTTPPPVEPSHEKSYDVISANAERLGIHESTLEKNRWNTIRTAFPAVNREKGKSYQKEAQQRLSHLQQAMRESENPDMRQAALYLDSLGDSVRLVSVATPLPTVSNIGSLMDTAIIADPEREGTVARIRVQEEYLFSGLAPEYLATVLAHEARHTKEFMTELAKLPSSLSPIERQRAIEAYYTIHTDDVEARGYATQVNAYIAAVGLTRFNASNIDQKLGDSAAYFIKSCESNEANPLWVQWVKDVSRKRTVGEITPVPFSA